MSDVPTGTILAVDDTKYNLDLLVDTLGDQHDLSVAMNGTTERREGCWGIDNAIGNKPGEDPLDNRCLFRFTLRSFLTT